jgi:hypothetical protein
MIPKYILRNYCVLHTVVVTLLLFAGKVQLNSETKTVLNSSQKIDERNEKKLTIITVKVGKPLSQRS